MRFTTFFLLSLAAFALPSSAKAAALPNVVILYADDMGYGDLGVQNPDSKIPTPNLDRLASEGTRFTDAHSSSGICSPSRYALLTGRYHWRKMHDIVQSFGPSVFEPGQMTVARMFQQQGYRTACIGKWHLGWDWAAIMKPGAQPEGKSGYPPGAFDWSKAIPSGPLAQGFDHYFGDDVPNFPPYTWIENDHVLTPPTLPVDPQPEATEGHWEARPGPMAAGWRLDAVMPTLTEHALAWLKKQSADKPFFLYFPFTSPHAPIVPAKEFQGKSKAGGYGDYVVQTDWTVGEVLKALKAQGLEENTLVIFSADNGPETYAYERVRNFDHRSMGPLRGVKRDIWEGGHRVPFVVRWPGKVKAGAVSDGLISQVDVMATLAAVIGAELPATAADDSHNQLPLWLGESSGSSRNSIVHNTKKDVYAVREGNWVLIDAKEGNHSKVPNWFDEANGYQPNRQAGQLFNLADDLSEHKNHYADLPEKVAEMRDLLKKTREHGEVREGLHTSPSE